MENANFNAGRAWKSFKAEDAEIAAAISFSDRPSFIAWRAAWRQAYGEAAAKIREARLAARSAASTEDERGSAQSARERGRIAARNLMLLRTVADARRPQRKVDAAA